MDQFNHKETIRNLKYLFVKSKHSKLSFDANRDLKDAFKYLSQLFNLTHIQCALLSVVFAFTIDEDLERVSSLRLLNFLSLELDDYFEIKGDIEVLIQKGFIKQKKEDDTDNIYHSSFVVNQKLLDMLFRNEVIDLARLAGNKNDFPQFCGHAYGIIRKKLINQQSQEQIYNSIIEYEEQNLIIFQIQILNSLELDIKDRIVIYCLTHNLCELKEEVTIYSLAFDIHGIANSGSFVKRLKDGTSKLQLNGLIEVVKNEVLLTTKAKELLLEKDSLIEKNEESIETSHYFIKYDSIPEKELYFNSELQRELSILETLLQKDNFLEYQKEMKLRGNKMEGVSILLYGQHSGTGKSSIAEQLARVTQRNILQVDMSAIRSRWYGESEKGIKKIFDEYESVCSKVGNTPILLLNECDALLSKRNNAGEDRHDQTEAIMTNLLLEHFEKNKGIIIGITNLVENLDPAFMRRFTMKYLIDKPTKKAVRSILRSKLNFLDEREVGLIADRYLLTGGEIENVSQRCIISKIITKSYPTVSEVMDFCDDEKIKINPWKEVY